MNAQELKDFQEKARQEQERRASAEYQKGEREKAEKAIKENIDKEQKALKEAHQKERDRVKTLNESAKEKKREQQRYRPVFDRAEMERRQHAQAHPHQQQPRQTHHYNRAGEDGMTRELNTVRQIMCRKEATERLEKMTPEQQDTLKKSFESEMAKTGDNRKLTDAGLHHKLSEKIMDDKGVARPDHTDLVGIAQGQQGMGRDVTTTDLTRAREAKWYVPEKPQEAKPWQGKNRQAQEHGQEPAQEKPWKHQQQADPDRAESRMAAQSRAQERDEQSR